MAFPKTDLKKNTRLLLYVLAVISIVSLVTVLTDTREKSYKPGVSATYDMAVNQARSVYGASIREGVNLSAGPCLTNALLPDWVLDISHNPRQVIDDLPENQCQSFIEGKSKHFVEMDANGNILRVR